jgi:hypothetical protein
VKRGGTAVVAFHGRIATGTPSTAASNRNAHLSPRGNRLIKQLSQTTRATTTTGPAVPSTTTTATSDDEHIDAA